MKKHTIAILCLMVIMISLMSVGMTSCKKKNNSTPDSATFLFHLHTQIIDSTIGGNTDGYDSNTTGSFSHSPWCFDSLGRRIKLLVPQFFVSNIMLVNANGTNLSLNNVVVLKGLDSEDYYLCKVPVGTYVSATFTVGLSNTDDVVTPATNFITDGIPYPLQSSMWNGTNYYGMVITGAYDPVATDTALNPAGAIPFSFGIPNSLTTATQVTLPTRGTTAYPVYLATAGSINYIHILCDYGKLLSGINLQTSNQTSVNPLIADTLAARIPNMFRYEQ
jgi:hypothetical protein